MIVSLTRFSGGGLSAAWNILSLLFIFVIVLVLAYYSTKFIAKYQNNTLNVKSNIKIIESFRIGNNKYIAIAMIAGEYYALAVGKDEINTIDKLDKATVEKCIAEKNDTNSSSSFMDILSKVKKNDSTKNKNDNLEKTSFGSVDNETKDDEITK